MKTSLNMSRTFLFMKRQALLNTNTLLVASGAILGTLFMISLVIMYYAPTNIPVLIPIYDTAFFAGGFIFTSRIFSELHVSQKSYAWLTLPVSTLEKLIGSWLLSSVVFIIAFKATSILVYFLACLICQKTEYFQLMFSLKELRDVGVFMVDQSIFFLGAIYFRNNNFMKTILALFIISVAITTFSLLLALTMFKGHEGTFSIGTKEITESSKLVIDFAFWALLGPYMLIVSYFRLKERQV